MDRKKIAALPHEKAESTGKFVKSYIVDGILILDCYESRKYIGRYCMREDGKYSYFSEKDQKWNQSKLCCLYGSEWYYSCGAEVKCSEESEKLVLEFTNYRGGSRSPVGRAIDHMETEYNRERRQAAYVRKRDRINALMDEVPVLPKEFYAWLDDTVFSGQEYMFKTSPTSWKCTACGKEHTSKKPYKNNQIIKCSRTSKEVTVKSRNIAIKKKAPVLIFQVMDDRRSVTRHFLAEKVWSETESETEAYENIRYILGKNSLFDDLGRALGLPSHPAIPDVIWYYGQYRSADEFAQEWWDSNPVNKRCNQEYCYPIGVREALKGTAYEKMHLETFANLGWKLQYNKMMISKDQCGFMEYLAKAGLKKLTEEASDKFSVWGGFWDGNMLKTTGRNASGVLGINMQRFHRLRQHDGGFRYLKWLRYEEENGKNLPEKTITWMAKNGINPDDIKFIADRMTPVQVANYLNRQAKESKKTPHSLLEPWKDYLSMAARLEMDCNDEIVYRTKLLLHRHDELAEILSSMDEDEQAADMKKKYPDVERILTEIKDRYEYENDKYLLVVPSQIQDIMRDSRQLHHCAGGSERYYERINKRETYIMFVRKKSRPLYAWYTLEVEPGGTVRQKRSEYNRQPEVEEVKKFIAEWQKVLKDRLKQEDKELAARSKRIRIMEMKELKTNNERFAGVLEADLMEVI